MAVFEFAGLASENWEFILHSSISMPLAFILTGLQIRWYADSAVIYSGSNTVQRSITAPADKSNELQFEQVVTIVETARTRTNAAVDSHNIAREKVDAAEYALHRLYLDLGSAMPQLAAPHVASNAHDENPEEINKPTDISNTAEAA